MVEHAALTGDAWARAVPGKRSDGADLDALLGQRASTHAALPALAGSPGAIAWTHTELALRIDAIAAQLRELGLEAGSTALVVGGASPDAVASIFAVRQAGLRLALLALGGDASALAAACVAAGAEALIGCGGHEFGNLAALVASAAAGAPCVRFVAVCGGEPASGIINLGAPAGYPLSSPAPSPTPAMQPMLSFGREAGAAAGSLFTMEEIAASAASLRAMLPDTGAAVFSTLPPLSMAGLVAGPWLAWGGDAPLSLHLHGPFDSHAFVDALTCAGPAHLVIPEALASAVLQAPDAVRNIASLILVQRHASPAAMAAAIPRLAGVTKVPAVDLHCVNEALTLPVARDSNGRARSVAETACGPDDYSRRSGSGATRNLPTAPGSVDSDAVRRERHRGSL